MDADGDAAVEGWNRMSEAKELSGVPRRCVGHAWGQASPEGDAGTEPDRLF